MKNEAIKYPHNIPEKTKAHTTLTIATPNNGTIKKQESKFIMGIATNFVKGLIEYTAIIHCTASEPARNTSDC
jgi:hypothetical protein